MALPSPNIAILTIFLLWNYTFAGEASSEPKNERSYRPPFDRSLEGKAFHYTDDYLSSIDIPPSKFTELTGDFTKQFVIATGASADHFEESIDGVASVQEHFKHRKLLYFDLGLNQNQINMLLPDGGNGAARRIICNVEYRKFDFSRYPEHVKDLYYYSWKFLIIKEMLEEFGAVFWIDSSVRFKTGNFMYELQLQLQKSGGIVLFSKTGHSTYAVTDEGLYDYFPTNQSALMTTEQWEGGNILVYNTKEAYDNVLRWMYYCVLDKNCISPSEHKKRGCFFEKDRWGVRAGCHRHDQSTVNLLLANWFDFQVDRYVFSKRKVNEVTRYPSKFHTLQRCDPLPSVSKIVVETGGNKVKMLPREEL